MNKDVVIDKNREEKLAENYNKIIQDIMAMANRHLGTELTTTNKDQLINHIAKTLDIKKDHIRIENNQLTIHPKVLMQYEIDLGEK